MRPVATVINHGDNIGRPLVAVGWYKGIRSMGKLTAIQVRTLSNPGRYSDGKGLCLLIRPHGSKSWMLRIQVDGRRRDLGLGSQTELTLAQAREAATDLRYQCHTQGFADKPSPGRSYASSDRFGHLAYTTRKIVPTFRAAAIEVHAERLQSWKNSNHRAQWLASLENYVFPFLGDMLVNEVEGPAIRAVLVKIWLAKPETARRVRQRIGAVLDWSFGSGFRDSEVSMRLLSMTLPRQPKKKRHFEAMSYTEVPTFLAAVREGTQSMGRFALEALVLTATRSGEVLGARWGEVDRKAAVWTIPAERMKADVKHVIPLSDAALAVFDRAAMYRMPCTDLVFFGQKPKQPLSNMTLLKIVRDMVAGVTVHGFRSSFRDWVAEETNFPGEIAEAALAHTNPNKIEAAYRRTDFLAKRRAMMADWAVYCAGASDSVAPP